jgi:hypothetical protein
VTPESSSSPSSLLRGVERTLPCARPTIKTENITNAKNIIIEILLLIVVIALFTLLVFFFFFLTERERDWMLPLPRGKGRPFP